MAAQNLAKEMQRGDNNRRDVRVLCELLGIEGIEAIHAAEENLTTVALVGRAGVELVSLQSVGSVVISEGLSAWIEAGQATDSADPEIGAAPVRRDILLQDSADLVAWQSILDPVMGKGLRLAIKAVEPSARAHPKPPRRIFEQRQHRVATQTSEILRVRLIVGPLFPLKPVEPVFGCAKPERTRAILKDGRSPAIAPPGAIPT